MFIVLPLGWI